MSSSSMNLVFLRVLGYSTLSICVNILDSAERVILMVYHGGVPGSTPGENMWDLRWTKRHWDRFSPSTSVSFATHPSG
jgi:hypothetical protein